MEYELEDRVTLFKAKPPPLPAELENMTFGAVFIDGGHETEEVSADWENIKGRVDGLVLFHDLHKKIGMPCRYE